MSGAIDYGSRLRVGMLLPSGNAIAEAQIEAMSPQGVRFHTHRLKLTGSSEQELLGMTRDVEPAAQLLADGGVGRIVFHCTAVTTFDPKLESSILQRIEAATGLPATATSQALVEALKALGARRVVMISPYIEAVNAREAAFLAHHGIEVLRYRGCDAFSAKDMIAIDPGRWVALARETAHADAQACLVSCTTVRSAEAIEAIEDTLGVPVVTSNQAMVWHVLRAAGIADRVEGFGRLLRMH